ncbi:hypothetical protein PAXRUDRAFT_147779, partial [Paxillus rubicundulus Ve08.2h10]
CQQLYKLHVYQNVLNQKEPQEANMKFILKCHQCQELDSIYLKYKGVRQLIEEVSFTNEVVCTVNSCFEDNGTSPWLCFAKGMSNRLYKEQDMLLGMVEVMVKKAQCLALGQHLQNMQYTDAFDSFCSILLSLSPQAYKTFHHHFSGWSLPSMWYVIPASAHILSSLK